MATKLFIVMCAFMVKGIYSSCLPYAASPAFLPNLPTASPAFLPTALSADIMTPYGILPNRGSVLPIDIANPPLANKLVETMQLLTMSSLLDNKLPLGAMGLHADIPVAYPSSHAGYPFADFVNPWGYPSLWNPGCAPVLY